MGLQSFLIVAAILFAIGLYGALTKRNAVTVLMCMELMFNAVNITAVALSRYVVPAALAGGDAVPADVAKTLLTGQIFTIFIITVAAAEVALGVAILIAIFRHRETVFVTDANQMRH